MLPCALQHWWLPGWLDRLLPRIQIEGAQATAVLPEADVAGS